VFLVMVEDETLVGDRIERLSRELLGNDLSKLRRFDNLTEAMNFIETNPIDLLLLDLQLHGECGFEVLRQSVAESFHTIIVSAHTDQAITAFEFGVLDFVPKPFSKRRLGQALDRYRDHSAWSQSRTKVLAVKSAGNLQMIAMDRIAYIKGADYCSEIHLVKGSPKVHAKTLRKLMAVLPKPFVRIHKSFIANLNFAQEIRNYPGSKYELIMKDGTVLPVGRTKYRDLVTHFPT